MTNLMGINGNYENMVAFMQQLFFALCPKSAIDLRPQRMAVRAFPHRTETAQIPIMQVTESAGSDRNSPASVLSRRPTRSDNGTLPVDRIHRWNR